MKIIYAKLKYVGLLKKHSRYFLFYLKKELLFKFSYGSCVFINTFTFFFNFENF